MRQILVLLVVLIFSGLLICGYRLNEDLSKLEEAFAVAHDLDDKNLIVIDSVPSPDGRYAYYQFHFDHGNFGYSRAFWAVIERDATQRKLTDGLLPDGYRAIGWTENSELIINPWRHDYSTPRAEILRSEDSINGVPLKIRNTTTPQN